MNPYYIKYIGEKEVAHRIVCSVPLLRELKKAGFKTNGDEHHLEKILQEKGFGLPVKYGEHFMFSIGKYIRFYLNYADSLSEEILLLRKLKMI